MQWRTAIREVTARPLRSALTVTSIVIGVAAVVAVSLANGTLQRSYQAMHQAVAGEAALEVVAAGGALFDEGLTDIVAETPGVEAAVPLIQRSTILYHQGKKSKLSVMGIDPSLDRAVRDYELAEGDMFPDGEGILLNQQFASGLGLQVDDPVKLLTPRGLTETTVVGLLRPRSEAAISQGAMVFMSLEEAQRRFKARGELDRIQVVVSPEAEEAAVMKAISERIPEGTEVRRPMTHSRMADETAYSLEHGMKLASWFALLASVFIIINTFSMNVGQRRKQLAIMRAVGATRGQISGLIHREAAVMAVIGSAIGVVVGIAGAYGLTATMGELFQTHLPPIKIEPLPVALAVAMGMGISLIGAYLPARRAGKLTPLEAMSALTKYDSEGITPQITRFSLVALIISTALLVARLVGWLPAYDPVAGVVLVLLFSVPMVPLTLPVLSQAVATALKPWASVEPRLAQLQLLRHRTRTALTVGVLFVAASTAVGLSISLVETVEDVRRWSRAAIVGDFFVRASMPDMQTGLSAAMPDDVGDELRKVPGITTLDAARWVSATVQGEQAIVVARQFPTPDEVRFDINDYDPAALRQELIDGKVVIGSVLAVRTKKKAGDDIDLETRHGTQKMRIVAVSDDYLAGGLTLHMHRPVAEKLLDLQGVDAFVVKAQKEQLPQVQAALQTICKRHGLILQSFSDVSRLIDAMMSGVVGSLWALLTLGLIVAGFGMANTLNMNVMEQTRELAMLRVVAMTRRQVRKMVMSQAIMLAVIGLTPGVALGVALAFAINVATQPATGHTVSFAFHPALISGVFVVSMILILAAAYLPARRAAKMEPIQALRYE